MNEKVKHRIVGVIVIAAFLVIIVPAFIKNIGWQNDGSKNSQAFNASADQALSEMPAATETFQTSQIAQVSLDHPTEPAQPITPTNPANLAEDTSSMMVNTNTQTNVPVQAEASSFAQPVIPKQAVPAQTTAASTQAVSATAQPAPAPKAVSKPVVIQPKQVPVHIVPARKAIIIPAKSTQMAQKPVKICIQMGTFANPMNAQLLVERLKAKGFYSAKAEPATFPNGAKGQRVSMCRQMTIAEARAMRARVAQVTGNAMIIQQDK